MDSDACPNDTVLLSPIKARLHCLTIELSSVELDSVVQWSWGYDWRRSISLRLGRQVVDVEMLKLSDWIVGS